MTIRARSLIVVLALGLVAACRHDTPEQAETETAVLVQVDTAKQGPLREVVAATGTVSAGPGAELIVTAPVAARIVEMPKAEGDRVRAGDLLVRFEIPSLAAEAASGRAAIEQAEARVDNAKAAAARVAGLFERGVAARKDVEDAERELREANAALSQARSTSGAAGVLAGREIVRAGFNGVVAKRLHNPGDFVEPGPGDPILRVIDPAHLEVAAAVPVSALAHISAGAPAHVTVPGSEVSLDATVIARPAAVDPGSVTATVRLRPATPATLTGGMAVQVEILGPEHPSVIIVPIAAIIRDGESTYVMTYGADNKAHRKDVEVGVTTRDEAEITKGLAAGERVIVRGQNGLPDGAAVTIGS
jgi:RND family efflux transporter MFP subunit